MKKLNRNELRNLIKESLLLEQISKSDLDKFKELYSDLSDSISDDDEPVQDQLEDAAISFTTAYKQNKKELLAKTVIKLNTLSTVSDSLQYGKPEALKLTALIDFIHKVKGTKSVEDLTRGEQGTYPPAPLPAVSTSTGYKTPSEIDPDRKRAGSERKKATKLEFVGPSFDGTSSPKTKEAAVAAVVEGKSHTNPIIFILKYSNGTVQTWGTYKLEKGKYYYVQHSKNPYKGLESNWKTLPSSGIKNLQGKNPKRANYPSLITPVVIFGDDKPKKSNVYIHPGVTYVDGKIKRKPGVELDASTDQFKFVKVYDPSKELETLSETVSLSRGSLYRKRYYRY